MRDGVAVPAQTNRLSRLTTNYIYIYILRSTQVSVPEIGEWFLNRNA